MAFTGVARLFMMMNSCINPIVYASTIPAFKDLVKATFSCKFGNDLNDLAAATYKSYKYTSKRRNSDQIIININKTEPDTPNV